MRYLFKLIVASLNTRIQGEQVIHLIIKNIFTGVKLGREMEGQLLGAVESGWRWKRRQHICWVWRGGETSRTSPQHFSKNYSALTFIGNTLEVFTVQEVNRKWWACVVQLMSLHVDAPDTIICLNVHVAAEQRRRSGSKTQSWVKESYEGHITERDTSKPFMVVEEIQGKYYEGKSKELWGGGIWRVKGGYGGGQTGRIHEETGRWKKGIVKKGPEVSMEVLVDNWSSLL